MDVHPLSDMLRQFQAVPDPRRFNVTYYRVMAEPSGIGA